MSPCSRMDSRTSSLSSAIFSTVVASLSVAPAAVARSTSTASNSSRIASVDSGSDRVRVFSLLPSKLNENERPCALGFSASPSGIVRIDALIRPPPQVLYRGERRALQQDDPAARQGGLSRDRRSGGPGADHRHVPDIGLSHELVHFPVPASRRRASARRRRRSMTLLPPQIYRLAWDSQHPDPARRPGEARLPQPDPQFRRGMHLGTGTEIDEHREEIRRRRRPAGGF